MPIIEEVNENYEKEMEERRRLLRRIRVRDTQRQEIDAVAGAAPTVNQVRIDNAISALEGSQFGRSALGREVTPILRELRRENRIGFADLGDRMQF